MNKYAAEKIAQEYYALGVQYALQNAGLLKTADPILDTARNVGEASVLGDKNYTPYKPPGPGERISGRGILESKYNMSPADAVELDAKAMGAGWENRSRVMDYMNPMVGRLKRGLSYGAPIRVPYR